MNKLFHFLLIFSIGFFLLGCNEEEKNKKTDLRILESFPESLSERIDDRSSIKLTFNQDILENSVTTQDVLLKDANGSSVDLTFWITKNEITIYPKTSLKYEEKYTLYVTRGVMSVTGHSLPTMFSLQFTTEEKPIVPDEVASIDIFGTITDIRIRGTYAYVLDNSNGLIVYDVTDMTNPSELSKLPLYASNTALVLYEDFAYILASDGIHIIDVSNPNIATEIGKKTVQNQSGYYYLSDGYNASGLLVDDNRLFVFDLYMEGGFVIFDLSTPQAPEMIGEYVTSLTLSPIVNSMAVKGNYAYVTFGDDGLEVVDISDPSDPQRVTLYQGDVDFFDEIALQGNYLYVMDRWADKFVILNISNPESPQKISSYSMSAATDFLFADGDVFLVGYESISILDISTPSSPILKGSIVMESGRKEIAYSDNHLLGSSKNSLFTLNVSNRMNPLVSYLDTDVNSGFMATAIQNDYVYIVDNNGSSVDLIKVYDVSDLSNISMIASSTLTGGFDWGGGNLQINGNYLYTLTYGSDLHIYDISDPAAISETARIEDLNTSYRSSFCIDGNISYFLGMYGSLYLYDISKPTNPSFIRALDLNISYVTDVEVKGNYLYVSKWGYGDDGIAIYNISNLDSPRKIEMERLSQSRSMDNDDISIDENAQRLYVLARKSDFYTDGISVFDISDPEHPVKIRTYEKSTYERGIDIGVKGDNMFITDYTGGLSVIDVSE